jgi:fucose permease
MTSGWILATLVFSGACTFGMVLNLLTTLQSALAKRLALAESQVARYHSVFLALLIPALLLAGALIDLWDLKQVLIFGSLLLALGAFGMTLARRTSEVLAALLLMSLGSAGLGSACVVLMPTAFWPDQPAASLNLGYLFLTFGVLIAAPTASLLLRTWQVRRTLELFALVCLVPALLAVPLDLTRLLSPSDWRAEIWDDRLWLTGLILLLYSPLEFAVRNWAPRFLTGLGYPEPSSTRWLRGFWVTFLGSRLLFAWLLQRGVLWEPRLPWILLLLGIGAAMIVGHLAGTSHRGRAAWGLLLLGCLLGPVFPTLAGMLFHPLPDAVGTAQGAMLAVGCFGHLAVGPITQAYAQRRTSQLAWGYLAPVAVILVGATLVLALKP